MRVTTKSFSTAVMWSSNVVIYCLCTVLHGAKYEITCLGQSGLRLHGHELPTPGPKISTVHRGRVYAYAWENQSLPCRISVEEISQRKASGSTSSQIASNSPGKLSSDSVTKLSDSNRPNTKNRQPWPVIVLIA